MNHLNNFDFLRFAAASLVLFSHSYPISGHQTEEPFRRLTGYESGGGLAVAIFFIISGYLVCGSYLNSKHWIHFVWKRSLRLFPALTAAVLLAILVIGPLFTAKGAGEYFSSPLTWSYLKNIFLYIHYYLPGVFSDNPYPGAVNGSLWTLPVEVAMYALLLAIGMARLLTQRAILFVVLIFLLCHLLSGNIGKLVILGVLPLHYVFKLGVYFFAGSAIYLFRDRIKFRNDLFLCMLAFIMATFNTPAGELAMMLLLPYLVIHFAYMRFGRLHEFGRFGDFSYGIYVFAFPVQQCVMNLSGPGVNVMVFAAISFLITLLLAVASWYFVERPALALKRVRLDVYIPSVLQRVMPRSVVKRGVLQEENHPSSPDVGGDKLT